MINSVRNKKILFIGIGFYDYEKAISDILKRYGAEVRYFNSSQVSAGIRLLRRLRLKRWADILQSRMRRQNIMQYTQNDIVFIIKGECLTQEDVSLLKENNPNARFLLYLWDSLVRHSNADVLLNNFEHIRSFDRIDCLHHPQLRFRPLFYREIVPVSQKKYFISFIGWMHTDRLKMIRALRKIMREKRKSYFLKLYTGRVNYLFQRYLFQTIQAQDRELFVFEPVSYENVKSLNAQSSVVFDWAHPLQSGLTMRTIEALAQGCYVVTNNRDIIHYKEIDPHCYFVIDKMEDILPVCDSHPEGFRLSDEFCRKFSIEQFLTDIFC